MLATIHAIVWKAQSDQQGTNVKLMAIGAHDIGNYLNN
jgi:hypothetical protein